MTPVPRADLALPTAACETILVTGGAGFIGSHTAECLLKKGHQVVVVDEMNDYYDPCLKRNNIDILRKTNGASFYFYELDICDKEAMGDVFSRHRPGLVCHLAARAGVRASIQQPDLYVHSNVQGTLAMLQLAVQYKVRNFVFASSSSVYGSHAQQTTAGFSESKSSTDYPISPYAATKKAAESLAYAYHAIYGLPCSGLRFFTVYGPRGRPDMAPYKFVQSILRGEPIVQFGDGDSQRDYTFIDDVVQGITAALFTPVPFEIYNLGRGQPVTLRDLIGTIEGLLNKKGIIRLGHKQPGDVDFTMADVSKARALLGYSPKTSIAEGMQQFIEWCSGTAVAVNERRARLRPATKKLPPSGQ